MRQRNLAAALGRVARARQAEAEAGEFLLHEADEQVGHRHALAPQHLHVDAVEGIQRGIERDQAELGRRADQQAAMPRPGT